MDKRNENMLVGIRCPNPTCGSLGPFNVWGKTQFMGVTDTSSGDSTGMSWDDNSDITCCSCYYYGTVGRFTEKESAPVFKVWIQIERVDEDADCDDNRYQNIGDPDVLRVCNTLEEAETFMDAAILGAQAGRGE